MKEPPAPPPESTAARTALSPVAAAVASVLRYGEASTPGAQPVAAGSTGVPTPSAVVSTVAVIALAAVSFVVSSVSYSWHASSAGVVR